MKQHFRLLAVAVCLITAVTVASPAEAQCQADYVHTYSTNDLNEFGFLLQAARSTDPSCRVQAHNKLHDKLNSIWTQNNGPVYWKGWLVGAYLSLVTATGMELAGANTFSADLDYQIYRATTAYAADGKGAAGDPCGLQAFEDPNGPLAGKQMWRRANSCMDDHTIAAQGWAWITAYYRQSGRSYATARANAISEIKKSFSTYDSICVFNRALYDTQSSNGTVEANVCNKTIPDLQYAGNELLSLNHGNQAINYGFGLLSSIATAFFALDIANVPVNTATELTLDEKRVIKYLWKEAAVHTTSDGRFHRTADGNANCYNMINPLTGTRVLRDGWGCQDEQFAEGDPTEGSGINFELQDKTGPRGYKAKFFPLARFYERYGFTKGDGSGNGYGFDSFSEGTFWGTADVQPWMTPDEQAYFLGKFFGAARLETYREMAWAWLLSAPALTAGSEFRVAIQSNNGQYFQATGGGGSTLYATGTWKDDPYATLYIYDLNGAHLRGGDPVAIAIRSGSTRYWMVAENGGGSVVNINRVYSDPLLTGPWERFTIERVSGPVNDMISNGEQFALKAANGQYVVAENGGGGVINANRSVRGAWETFTFVKTERP